MINTVPLRQHGLLLSLFFIAFCCSCSASSKLGITPLTRVSIVVPANVLAYGTPDLTAIVHYTLVTSGDGDGNGGLIEEGTVKIPLIATFSYDEDGGRKYYSNEYYIPIGATIEVGLYSGPISSVSNPVAVYEGTYQGGGMITLDP